MNTYASDGRNPPVIIRVAAISLWIASGARTIAFVVTVGVVDWGAILESSPTNAALTSMGVVLGGFIGVGAFIALPIATGVEAWRLHKFAVVLAIVQAALAALGLVAFDWAGILLFVIQGTAFVLVASPQGRRAKRRTDSPGIRFSTVLGYVLLVTGGLWGLHNFYLKRGWAGILCVGLLLVTIVTWGGLVSYIAFGSLGALLLRDAILMPARTRSLRQDWLPRAQRL